MTIDENVKQHLKIIKIALALSFIAKSSGLLALEDEIDSDAIKDMEILKSGLRMIVDGTDLEIIKEKLSIMIEQEKDDSISILKNMQKDTIIMIQEGLSAIFIYAVLNSYPIITGKFEYSEVDLPEGTTEDDLPSFLV